MKSKSMLFSAAYSKNAVDWSALVLRIVFGGLMVPHGYAKLVGFAEKQHSFMNFLGLGSAVSLGLTIFAELICAALLVIGLYTRLALIPLLILTVVIVFISHEGDIFGKAFSGFAYLTAYLVIFLLGPGKYSVDARR